MLDNVNLELDRTLMKNRRGTCSGRTIVTAESSGRHHGVSQVWNLGIIKLQWITDFQHEVVHVYDQVEQWCYDVQHPQNYWITLSWILTETFVNYYFLNVSELNRRALRFVAHYCFASFCFPLNFRSDCYIICQLPFEMLGYVICEHIWSLAK